MVTGILECTDGSFIQKHRGEGMKFGGTAKLDLIQLVMRSFLRIQRWKVAWVEASMKRQTIILRKASLLRMNYKKKKSRFLKIHKLMWRPLEKIIERIKE